METQRTKQRRQSQPCDPLSLERQVRQLLADKLSGNLVGLWLLLPEHLRLGTWDLLCGWTGCLGQQVEPRLALQLVHEAALCNHTLRRLRSLSQRGFELANGLPFVASDKAVHELLDAHTVAEAQELQVALGQIRRASGHYPGRLLALDPHRIRSYSQRQMRRRKDGPQAEAVKVTQTFFCLDADSSQPLCFTLGTSGLSVAQASPNLLAMGARILKGSEQAALVMADCEHFSDELLAHVQQQTPFELLAPLPRVPRNLQLVEALGDQQFTRRWAGFATAKTSFQLLRGQADPCWLFVQQSGEKPEPCTRKAFLCTADRPEAEDLALHYPARWRVEEFFNREQAMGWQRAGTLNLNIRYGAMTLALIAQAALHQLRGRLGQPFATWDAEHLARGFLQALDGDLRVRGDTIVVTYYNAPQAQRLRSEFCDLPDRLRQEHIDPRIPWLYNLKLDFRFR